jgi:hypothetical protein
MKNSDIHVSDQDLLLALDGELSPREASRVQGHLEACWKCRARRLTLDRTIVDFVAAHQRRTEADLPTIDGPRALLRARLGQSAAVEPFTSLQRFRQFVFRVRRTVYAGAVLCVAGLIGLIPYFNLEQVRADSVPDSSLTPGATRTAHRHEICPARPVKGFYPIPATLAYRVFEKYGIRDPRPRAYEVDYLITPALGGADDIRNLWPQPFAAGEWNAHIKDALEDHLHEQVCAEKLDLETAQRDIAANWISAYQKYFNTDRPLAVHTTFSIDPPWQD